MLSVPYVFSSQETKDGTYSVSGVGDSLVGLKYKWFDRAQWVSALDLVLGVPSGDKGAFGNVTGKLDQPIPLGDGEYDFAVTGVVSKSLYPIPVYISASLAYRFRTTSGTTSYGNDIPWSVDAGYTFTFLEDKPDDWFKSVTIYSALRGLIATKDFNIGSVSAQAATGTLPSQEFITIQPGVLFQIHKNVGINSNFAYNLAGSNTGAGYGYRVGLTISR